MRLSPPRSRPAAQRQLRRLCGACLLLPRVALAQASAGDVSAATGASTSEAQALFERGWASFKAGDLDSACPKFAQSLRLEANDGTLLALATCHQKQHKLASAWFEFTEAEARARRHGDLTRAQYAQSALAELQPRLSSVLLEVSPDVAALAGLALSIDGSVVAASDWNAQLPLDGGTHRVEASAPEREPWQREFSLEPEASSARVPVPMLTLLGPAAAPPPVASSIDRDESSRWGSLEWWGIGSAGAGALSLGISGYFLAHALADNGQSPDATAEGNRATAFALVGGTLLTTGVTLFWLGRSRARDAEAPASLALSLGIPASGGWTLGVQGAL